MNNSQDDVYNCPSFSSYSSDRLAEIAGRVAVERSNDAPGNEGDAGDEDFEFAPVRDGGEVSLKEFLNGGRNEIGQVYPVFSGELLLDDGGESGACGGSRVLESSVAIPLGRLFLEEDEEGDYPPSCSSSEADELENVPAGAYCVWRPKMADAPVPGQCKKSKSTGSASRRWNLRDLLRRCKSDGKDGFVFINSNHKEEKSGGSSEARSASGGSGGAPRSPSAHEAFYIRSKARKEGDKKKSYLPYKQELVGFFANVNGLGRSSFPHF